MGMTIKNNDDLIFALALRKIMIHHKQYAKAQELTASIIEYVKKDQEVEDAERL